MPMLVQGVNIFILLHVSRILTSAMSIYVPKNDKNIYRLGIVCICNYGIIMFATLNE